MWPAEKENQPMKLTIEGDTKEIAALVLELQERQFGDVKIQLDSDTIRAQVSAIVREEFLRKGYPGPIIQQN